MSATSICRVAPWSRSYSLSDHVNILLTGNAVRRKEGGVATQGEVRRRDNAIRRWADVFATCMGVSSTIPVLHFYGVRTE